MQDYANGVLVRFSKVTISSDLITYQNQEDETRVRLLQRKSFIERYFTLLKSECFSNLLGFLVNWYCESLRTWHHLARPQT